MIMYLQEILILGMAAGGGYINTCFANIHKILILFGWVFSRLCQASSVFDLLWVPTTNG